MLPPDVARAYEEARAAWPTIDLDASTFAAWIAARGAPDALHTSDLYLACACALGSPAAHAAFDARVLPAIDATLTRAGAAAVLDEAKQLVRAKLLMPPGDRAPRIAEYEGKGSLVTWVRLVAARTASTLKRSERRAAAAHDRAALERVPAVVGPELELFRRRHAADFKRAFEAAVSGLSVRDRNLLCQHLLDRLGIDALADLYDVNRVTVARWLTRAREQVAEATRRGLAERLKLRGEELESVMRLVRSDLDLSLERVLGGKT